MGSGQRSSRRDEHSDQRKGKRAKRRLQGKWCLNKIREIEPELSYRTDYDLSLALDEAVHQCWDSRETWYEDDFAYGICENWVVEISEYMFSSTKMYAVVRSTPSDGQIIVTVIDEQNYGDSIVCGRWKERRPERSKYRHVGDEPEQEQAEAPRGPSLVHFPFEGLGERRAQMEQEQPVVVQPDPTDEPVILTYGQAHLTEHTNVVFTTIGQVTAVAQRLMEDQAVVPTSIKVWTKCQKQIKLKLVLE